MRTAIGLGAAILLLPLIGCSGDDDPAPAPATTGSPGVGLAETCEELQDAYPRGAVPDPDAWALFQAEVEAASEAGDAETASAIDGLIGAAAGLAADPQGADLLEARASLRDALEELRPLCSAAGADGFK